MLQGVVLLSDEPSQQQCRLPLSVKSKSHVATTDEEIEDISDTPPGY